MFNVKTLRIIHPSQVKLGEVVRLSMLKNAHAIVAALPENNQAGYSTVFVPFERPDEPFNFFYTEAAQGFATVLEGVTFEVDPAEADETKFAIGSLVRQGSKLAIVGANRNRTAELWFASDLEPKSSSRVIFPRWRAVIRDGHREHLVFAHGNQQG